MNYQRLKKVALLSPLAILSGCAAIQLQSGATKVLVSTNPPNDTCQYIGSATGSQGNFFTGFWTPNKNLETGAMNDLKNKAAAMGANYVQLVTNRASSTSSGSGTNGNYSSSTQQTGVTQVGNAYYCKKLPI